jgi:hypothetical protein
MLKNILKLDGAQELSKNEQKSIKGGLACNVDGNCPAGSQCVNDCRYTNICRLNSYIPC